MPTKSVQSGSEMRSRSTQGNRAVAMNQIGDGKAADFERIGAAQDQSKNESEPQRSMLNVAFIGVGNFVSGNHLPNMAASELWNIYGICDIDDANLTRAAERYRPAIVTPAYRQILADPKIDAVVLGVRHHDHIKFIREGAAAGKHMLVEKPMSMTQEQSLAIVDAVQSTDVRLMVGFNRRFAPAYVKAKEIIKEQHPNKPVLVTIRAVDDRRLWPDWPFDPKDGGGKILCECCHFFDLLSWLLDAEPMRIICEGYRSDENIVTIRFNDGSIGSIVSGGSGTVTYPKERLEVFCDSTTLVVEQNLELHAEGYRGVSDYSWPLKNDPFPEIGRDLTPVRAYRAKMNHWKDRGIDAGEYERRAYYDSIPAANFGHFNEITAFAEAILNHASSPVDEIDGMRATACCLAAIRSMETGYMPIEINEEDYLLQRKR